MKKEKKLETNIGVELSGGGQSHAPSSSDTCVSHRAEFFSRDIHARGPPTARKEHGVVRSSPEADRFRIRAKPEEAIDIEAKLENYLNATPKLRERQGEVYFRRETTIIRDVK